MIVISNYKWKWISEKISMTDEIVKPIPKKKELVSGEKVKLKDKIIRLKIHKVSKKRSTIEFENTSLQIYVDETLGEEKERRR